MQHHEWTLKRNCSLTPRQLLLAYGVHCVLTFGVAILVTLRGGWVVLAFAALEMGLLALALLSYARHATDHEHIALDAGSLLVEEVQGGVVRQYRLDPNRVRIAMPARRRDLVAIEARGVRLEVGRYVNDDLRRRFAQELKQELRGTLCN